MTDAVRPLTGRPQEIAAGLEAVTVAGAIGLFISAKTVQPYMWAGVGLLAASFAIRWAASGVLARRTPLDWPLLLFIASALVGVWAAYDQPVAWVKFLHILGGVGLYYVLASRGSARWFVLATVVGLSLFAAILALYFVTQFDYAAQPGKFAFITRLGAAINSISPRLPGQLPHANIIAGTLAMILPLAVAGAVHTRNKALRLLFVLCACVVAIAVVMSTSRGAWLALGVAGLAAVVGAWARPRLPAPWHGRLLVAGVLAVLLAAAVVVGSGDLLTRLLGSIPGGDRAIGRAELYGQAWGLIKDYGFTGSGLGMFGMVYSSYVLLIWVHFLGHAHNFFLQVWIEQGVLGFVALMWIVAAFYATAWRCRRQLSWLGWGALAAASVMFLHGFVDNPLYSFRVLPLIFVPLGLVVGGVQGAGSREEGAGSRDSGRKSAAGRWLGIGLAVMAVAAGAVGARNQVLGLWYANLGSVAQTRAELKDYTFPERLVDYVRHDADMSVAYGYFERALSYDTGNATARQRLAELALGRSEHDAARLYLEPLGQNASAGPITRQLLCEAYLGLGRSDDAFRLCSGVPGAATRLDGVAWVRYDRNKDTLRAQWARALADRVRKDGGY